MCTRHRTSLAQPQLPFAGGNIDQRQFGFHDQQGMPELSYEDNLDLPQLHSMRSSWIS
jgi:hypothetical protein